MIQTIDGDLLEQPVEVIVNSWNRNFIPHWLLVPQGVSGAIRRKAGSEPFREVRKHGLMAPGAAVLTGAGHLPYKGIIHVAGLQWWWAATRETVRLSTLNAMRVCQKSGFASIAFPLIGAGTGGLSPALVEGIMLRELEPLAHSVEIRVVRFRR